MKILSIDPQIKTTRSGYRDKEIRTRVLKKNSQVTSESFDYFVASLKQQIRIILFVTFPYIFQFKIWNKTKIYEAK